MRFTPTDIVGAFVVEAQPIEDERGRFARIFCRREFEAHHLNAQFVQCSASFNHRSGTLRGLHFQAEPFGEDKVIRCTRGAVFDVIADLRPGSASYKRWHGVTITADNGVMIYIPKGVAHGFITMAKDSEVFYQMSEFYYPEASRGVRWDDPDLAIQWPRQPLVISDRDRSLPTLRSLTTRTT
jgi:dTDP-4-dehydrorhamnose 3,5-epimerase